MIYLLLFAMYIVGYGAVYLILRAINPSFIVWIIAFIIAYNILTTIHKLLIAKMNNKQ